MISFQSMTNFPFRYQRGEIGNCERCNIEGTLQVLGLDSLALVQQMIPTCICDGVDNTALGCSIELRPTSPSEIGTTISDIMDYVTLKVPFKFWTSSNDVGFGPSIDWLVSRWRRRWKFMVLNFEFWERWHAVLAYNGYILDNTDTKMATAIKFK